MVAVIQKKAFKPGIYKGQVFTAARLKQFAEGTNKALSLKVPIPALKKHAKLAADDKETDQFAATDGAGWHTKLEVEDDGSLTPHFDVPEDIAAGISAGTIKFTSPEFRDSYKAADGRYEGPIIRHWAFTPLPKAHDQGALAIAMSEGVFQFGEDDYEGPPKDGDGDGEKSEVETSEKPPKNPDMPPKATDSTKLAAFVAGMAQLGVVLPSDFDLADDAALDLLITGINTQCKARQEAEAAEAKEKPEEPESKDAESGMPFSEDELAAMPEAKREFIKRSQAQAIQFSEERTAAAKEKAIGSITANLKWWPALQSALLAHVGTVQFSEDGEPLSLTAEKVAAMATELRPKSLQFAEEDGTEVAHPDGNAFFETPAGQRTPEQAEEFARRLHSRDKTKK